MDEALPNVGDTAELCETRRLPKPALVAGFVAFAQWRFNSHSREQRAYFFSGNGPFPIELQCVRTKVSRLRRSRKASVPPSLVTEYAATMLAKARQSSSFAPNKNE